MAKVKGRAHGVAIGPAAIRQDVAEGVVPPCVKLHACAQVFGHRHLHTAAHAVGAVPVCQGALRRKLPGHQRVYRVVRVRCAADVKRRQHGPNEQGSRAIVAHHQLAACGKRLNGDIHRQLELVARRQLCCQLLPQSCCGDARRQVGRAGLHGIVKAIREPSLGVVPRLQVKAHLVDVVQAGRVQVTEAGVEIEAADVRLWFGCPGRGTPQRSARQAVQAAAVGQRGEAEA